VSRRTAVALAAAFFAQAGPALAQCAMCQTVLTGSPEGHAMMGGLNRAILLMFAAPYLVFASCAVILFRHRIREAVRARLRPRRAH